MFLSLIPLTLTLLHVARLHSGVLFGRAHQSTHSTQGPHPHVLPAVDLLSSFFFAPKTCVCLYTLSAYYNVRVQDGEASFLSLSIHEFSLSYFPQLLFNIYVCAYACDLDLTLFVYVEDSFNSV